MGRSSRQLMLQGAEAQRGLQHVLRRFLLRRTKALIAHQMPRKLDYIVFCEMSDLQLAAYR